MRYIRYDLTNPDSVEQAGKDIREYASECEKGEVTFTPIQFVEILDTARSEGENQFVSLAIGLQSALPNLQSEVREVADHVKYLTTTAGTGVTFGTGLTDPRYHLPGRGFASLQSPVVSGAQGWLAPVGTGETIRRPAAASPQAPASAAGARIEEAERIPPPPGPEKDGK